MIRVSSVLRSRIKTRVHIAQTWIRQTSNIYSQEANTNLSHCCGPTGINLLDITIGKQLQDTADKYPDALALISAHQKRRVSYEEFNSKVTAVAKSLLALGLPSDAKIGVYAPNCEEWVLIQFACARIGFVLVNINPSYQVNDLAYVLKKVEISTLVMPRFLKSSDYVSIVNDVLGGELRNQQDPYSLQCSNLPDLRQIILLEDHTIGGIPESSENEALYERVWRENNMLPWRNFCSLATQGNAELERAFVVKQEAVHIHDPVNIQFTSGTTGLPKGAVLSHYNILNNGYLVGRLLKYNPHEAVKVLIQVPLYHCFGTVMGNLACVSHGATMVYPNGSFDGEQSLRVVEEERISSLYGVPTMFLELMNQQRKLVQKRDISSLKTGIMAGALCPKALMDRCINELGLVDLTICYGMTELSPVTHQTSPHDTIHKKTTTVGTLLPHTITKIVDEDGAVLPRMGVGEIWTKGYGVMLGYYNDHAATDEAVDSEGYMVRVYLSGLVKVKPLYTRVDLYYYFWLKLSAFLVENWRSWIY